MLYTLIDPRAMETAVLQFKPIQTLSPPHIPFPSLAAGLEEKTNSLSHPVKPKPSFSSEMFTSLHNVSIPSPQNS